MVRGLSAAALLMLALSPAALAKNKDAGSFQVGCLANDAALQTDENVSNTTAPALVTVSPGSLWPPHHRLADLTLTMSLAADSSASIDTTLQVTDITDDQVADDDEGGHGCGAKTSKQGADWVPASFPFPSSPQAGTLKSASDQVSITGVQVRRERCARDGTRTYTISVTCCDTTNNVCDSQDLLLTVPKSRVKHQ